MSQIIDLREGRILVATRKAFRNWVSRFKEDFGPDTRLSDISFDTLAYLAMGKEKNTFYLYDLVMGLNKLGSGFEFHQLSPHNKMMVIDRCLFLLDRVRFECMKRLGWLERYPGEPFPLVELVVHFDKLAPGLQAKIPDLSKHHPDYEAFNTTNVYDKEIFIRRLIPKLLAELEKSPSAS